MQKRDTCRVFVHALAKRLNLSQKVQGRLVESSFCNNKAHVLERLIYKVPKMTPNELAGILFSVADKKKNSSLFQLVQDDLISQPVGSLSRKVFHETVQEVSRTCSDYSDPRENAIFLERVHLYQEIIGRNLDPSKIQQLIKDKETPSALPSQNVDTGNHTCISSGMIQQLIKDEETRRLPSRNVPGNPCISSEGSLIKPQQNPRPGDIKPKDIKKQELSDKELAEALQKFADTQLETARINRNTTIIEVFRDFLK